MSKQPAVKPKVPPNKSGRKATSSSKDSKKENSKKEEKEVDTSKDEELARLLQEEMLSEQEESDAALARRLQEEEQSKRNATMLPPPHLPPGGRPSSATPIHQLLHRLFNLRTLASELEEGDENEETTPAMEPEAVGGATGTSTDRPRPSLGRPGVPGVGRPGLRPRRRIGSDRSPDRAGRGRGLMDRSPPDTSSPPDLPHDLLPGVRVNPNRGRGCPHPFGRRIFFNLNPENREVEREPESEDNPQAVDRRIAPPPGLGPREGTMAPPDGEYEPDLMILDSPSERSREDNFVHIMRDPFLLMLLLMGRDPTFMVPDDIDLGDYEALWDLAERLGEVQNRGMSQEEIAKLKPEVYRHKKSSDKDGEPEKCSVCLYEYKNGDKCIKLPCGHIFHQECLVEWLKRNATCPVCRNDVKKPS